MNRKNQNQNSSDRILKSKYLEKQKSKFITGSSLPSKKVMLTDLCPEQKLKIGELIKVNESRRQQILELTQQMNQIREKFTVCHSKLIQLEQQFQSKQQQCSKLTLKIQQMEQKSIEMDITNNKLTMQNKQLKEKIGKIDGIFKENRSCQTESTQKSDFSTQTKKNKTKNREIQVQTEQFFVKSKSNSKHHTKSFDRIIKDKDRSLKNSYSRSHNEIQYSQNNSSHRNEQQQDQENLENKEENQILVEQRLNDLAKQWLDLKQKKVSHLKAQYEHSKAHFFKDESPKQFTCEDLVNNLQDHAQSDEIDENQLNNLLKSKNFSASRLLTSKGLMNESQNSRKGSVNEKGQKPKNQQKSTAIGYSIKEPKLTLSSNHVRKIDKTPLYEKYSQPQNNFYESDFMELVNSLNE